jgi:hypothetical protein
MDSYLQIIEKIGSDLQRLEDSGGIDSDKKIRFPRGVLRKVNDIKAKLPFINNDVLRRNSAYHLLLCDFYCWFLNRFDIEFTAKEMLIKQYIVLTGSISHAIVSHLTGRRGFTPAVKELKTRRMIDETLEVELLWLWEIRNKIHYHSVEKVEFKDYTMNEFNKSGEILNKLVINLKKVPAPQKPSPELDNYLLRTMTGVPKSDVEEPYNEFYQNSNSEWDDLGDYDIASQIIESETDDD